MNETSPGRKPFQNAAIHTLARSLFHRTRLQHSLGWSSHEQRLDVSAVTPQMYFALRVLQKLDSLRQCNIQIERKRRSTVDSFGSTI